MEEYKLVGGKKLRYGYTTGSCAAAAALAATAILLSKDCPEEREMAELRTPGGTVLMLAAEDITEGFASLQAKEREWVSCAVRKDSGDDPDVTNGVLVYAKVQRRGGTGISIEGGKGVGRVTKPGLNRPVGAAAINDTPLAMIEENVRAMAGKYGYEGGLCVEISIPRGEELAASTFNPRLGIEGGISVLGTSGIVEPMSDDALISTIRAELSMRRAGGASQVLLTPGNYGRDFVRKYNFMFREEAVKCSNFIGDAFDIAVDLGFQKVLLVGHMGKLIKLAAGNFNTHSKWGDPRMEILTANGALAGASQVVCAQIMDSATTEQAVSVLMEEGLWEDVLARILSKIDRNLKARWRNQLEIGMVMFSNQHGILGTIGGDYASEVIDGGEAAEGKEISK